MGQDWVMENLRDIMQIFVEDYGETLTLTGVSTKISAAVLNKRDGSRIDFYQFWGSQMVGENKLRIISTTYIKFSNERDGSAVSSYAGHKMDEYIGI